MNTINKRLLTSDRYLEIDPWSIVEEGFDPSRGRVSESIFSLANEMMGVRGYFEEGYSGDRLQGSYFNHLYEEMQAQHPQVFKGIVSRVCFVVNAVDWLYTRITLDDETLDLATCEVTNFVRKLDMQNGNLTREFIWHTRSGKKLKVKFIRFLSMTDNHLGFQRISFEPMNFSGSISVRMGLDFSIIHEIADGWDQTQDTGVSVKKGKNFWNCPKMNFHENIASVLGQTTHSGHSLFSSLRLDSDCLKDKETVKNEKFAGFDCILDLKEGKNSSISRVVTNYWEKTSNMDTVWKKGIQRSEANESVTFEQAFDQQCSYWNQAWKEIDIEIDGDDEYLQGIRFSIFNLQQIYQGKDPRTNVPCKGLTGEVYHGQIFWDTESYTLPFYLFTNPPAARTLLEYRYNHLQQAKERAAQLDLVGARYPMCTLDGLESCATWQHGDFEIHVNVAVSYGIWLYNKLCGDTDFLYTKGAEVLVEICRFFADRGEFSPQNGDFGLWGVMGPDEYHMNINNNAYTNYMTRKTFTFTLAVLEQMQKDATRDYQKLVAKLKLETSEFEDWKHKSDKMRIPMNHELELYEQHDGYFDLPEVDVKNVPESQIPIYKNWEYLKIFRYNMIKQPDALLLTLFYSHEHSLKAKKNNYEYYEARCIHESSLSPGIHSILAAELGKHDEAYSFFQYMSRLDLDNRNKNTSQGLHVTSMSGAWLNMVYGFGGLRTDGDTLLFKPSIPKKWKSFAFKLKHAGALMEVKVDQENASFAILSGPAIEIKVFDKLCKINADGIKVPLQMVNEELTFA